MECSAFHSAYGIPTEFRSMNWDFVPRHLNPGLRLSSSPWLRKAGMIDRTTLRERSPSFNCMLNGVFPFINFARYPKSTNLHNKFVENRGATPMEIQPPETTLMIFSTSLSFSFSSTGMGTSFLITIITSGFKSRFFSISSAVEFSRSSIFFSFFSGDNTALIIISTDTVICCCVFNSY